MSSTDGSAVSKPLVASYQGPTDSKHFSKPLPPSTSSLTPEACTAALMALGESVSTLQAEINAFLTQKMELDNAAAGNASVKDAKDEENYGEEVV